MQSIDDYLKLASDPNWRINNLYSIVDKQSNRVPFQMNVVQKRIHDSQNKRKIVLKARQFGVSTYAIINLFDWVIHTENATACIIAHEQSAIEKLFRTVIRAYKFLPEDARPVLDRGGGSRYEYFFPEINSRIYCDLEVRGDTIGRLHVSEAAFMKDSARLKATLQAVPLNTGHVTIETTANGMANYFYDMWADPDSIYEKLFFPWYIFPEYQLPPMNKLIFTDDETELIKKAKRLYDVKITTNQIAYRRFKKSEMKRSDYDQKVVSFEQEYPEDDHTCFLSSGDAVLDLFAVNEMIQKCKDPIRIMNGIRIYKEKEKGRTYIIGADPAEGVGGDSSAAVVLDAQSFEVVAVYNSNKIKPADFADKLIEISEIFKTPSDMYAMIAVERNNHGHTVIYKLDQEGYRNIYMHHDEKLGFRTDGISRPLMLDRFVEAFDGGYLKPNDRAILSECLTLVNNNGKIEASTGKHDDLIIALSIALQVRPETNSSYFDLESRIKL